MKKARYSKGLAHYQLGEFDEALASYDQALTIDPNYIDALADKGLLLSQQGEFDEALTYFDQTLALEPEHIYALNNK